MNTVGAGRPASTAASTGATVSDLKHNDIDALCGMARTAQGPRLDDIRLALNELVQQEQMSWARGTTDQR